MSSPAETTGGSAPSPEAPGRRPSPGRVQVRVRMGARSHPGRVRDRNEDHYFVARLCKTMRIRATSLNPTSPKRESLEQGYLYMVADGTGGETGGEQASRIAIESVEDYVLNLLDWFLHLGGHDEALLREAFRQAIAQADRRIRRRAARHPSLHGMATTLTVAYSIGDELFLAHVGDTRAYLFRSGRLQQLTRDHTMVQLLIDSGQLSAEEARWHRRRNIVTNFIGGPSAGVVAEFSKARLQNGDLLLLCTDGLTESVELARIVQVLTAQANDPEASSRHLIRLSLEGGAPDNVTVIVARYQIVFH